MLLALLVGCALSTPGSIHLPPELTGEDAAEAEDSAVVDSGAEDTGGEEEEASDRWTFAVFMNGDNDLEEYVVHDLNELELVGSTDGVNVVVQADRIGGYDDADGDWTGTRRYLIKGDDDTDAVSSVMLSDLGELDMGDPAVLSDFLVWTDETFPAEHLAIVLWDHGDGWTFTGDGPPVSYGVSDDETSGSWLSVAEGEMVDALEAVVERRGPVDVVAFDACNMASWEVGHALRNSADYMAASEATVGWEGLQYGPALALLRDDPQASPADLADNLAYSAAVQGEEWTFSAVDLAGMNHLAATIDALAGHYLEDSARYGDWRAVRSASRSVDETYGPWYVDLADLAAVTAAAEDADEAALGQAVSDALSDVVVGTYGNDPYAWAGGLTVFTATKQTDYLDLYHEGAGASWAKATRWDDLLVALAGESALR